MKKVTWHQVPLHGLNIEPTLAAGDIDGVVSLTRYWWAREVIKKYTGNPVCVWDLGCGCGYGSRIVVQDLPQVRVAAVDVNPAALNAVRGDYGMIPGIEVIEQALDWPREAVVDWGLLAQREPPAAIVAFELFEALIHREIFLDNVCRSLSPGGAFLLNAAHCGRKVTTVNPPKAAVHYDQEMLRRLLRRYFETVRFSNERLAGDLFLLIDQVNDYVRKNVQPGADGLMDFPAIGEDLIYCADPLAAALA